MVLVLKNRIHGFCSFIKTSEVSLLYFYIFAIFYPIIPSYTLVFGVRFHSILGGLALVFLLLSKSFWKNFFSTKNILIFCLSTIFLVSASFLNGDLTTFSFYTLFINYFISPLYVFTMIDSYRKHKTTLNILLISGIILCVFALTEFTGFNIFSLIDNSDGLGLDHDIGKRFGLYRLESSFGQAIAFAIYQSRRRY